MAETGSTAGWGVRSSVPSSSTTQSVGIELCRLPVHLSRRTRAFRVHPRLRIGLHPTKKRFLPVCLCIRKFRSPRTGLRRPNTPGSPRILGVFGSNKGPFEPGPLLIADSTPRLRTAGSILAEQHEVALLLYRGANDLRLPQLFTTKRQKGWAVSVAGTMQISAGKLALRFLPASLSQLECELVA
jgi:hypothetical protein